MQLLLSGKTQPIDSVGSAVSPLTKLLGCLSKCHAGCDSAVDDRLKSQSICVHFHNLCRSQWVEAMRSKQSSDDSGLFTGQTDDAGIFASFSSNRTRNT